MRGFIKGFLFRFSGKVGYYKNKCAEDEAVECPDNMILFGNPSKLDEFFLDVLSKLREPTGMGLFNDWTEEMFENANVKLQDVIDFFRYKTRPVSEFPMRLIVWSESDKFEMVADEHRQISIIGFEDKMWLKDLLGRHGMKEYGTKELITTFQNHLHFGAFHLPLFDRIVTTFNLVKISPDDESS